MLARRVRNGHSVLVLVDPAQERFDGLLTRDIWFAEVDLVEWLHGAPWGRCVCWYVLND